MRHPWAETDANEFTDVDFDYAAILGYGIDQDGKPFLKALYFVPTDALLERQSPDENGVWKLPWRRTTSTRRAWSLVINLPASCISSSASAKPWNTNTIRWGITTATPKNKPPEQPNKKWRTFP